jgi:hypothetical protein
MDRAAAAVTMPYLYPLSDVCGTPSATARAIRDICDQRAKSQKQLSNNHQVEVGSYYVDGVGKSFVNNNRKSIFRAYYRP